MILSWVAAILKLDRGKQVVHARMHRAGRMLLAALFLCWNVAGLPAPAQDDPSAATVHQLKNDVARQTGAGATWQAAHLRDVLRVNDSLRTGRESIAEMHFGDGAITRLGPQTILRL